MTYVLYHVPYSNNNRVRLRASTWPTSGGPDSVEMESFQTLIEFIDGERA